MNLPVGLWMPLVFYGYISSTRGVGWFKTGRVSVQSMAGSYGTAGPIGFMLLVSGFAVSPGGAPCGAPACGRARPDEMSLLLELPPRSRRRKQKDGGASFGRLLRLGARRTFSPETKASPISQRPRPSATWPAMSPRRRVS